MPEDSLTGAARAAREFRPSATKTGSLKGSALQLFDSFNRTDSAPARHAESSFAFLNRTSRPAWQRVRDQLESYFSEYPSSDAAGLRSRFQDSSPRQHYAAWWELYLFVLFKRLGFVLEVEPVLDHTLKRPDFRATRNGELTFYIEAAVVFSGITPNDDEGNARDAWIFDITNLATSPDFHVGIEFAKRGMQRPAEREVVKPLERWLNSLNVDAVGASVDAGDDPPQLAVKVRDWEIIYEAYPISPEFRGQPGRLLGLYPGEGGVVNDEELLRKTIRKKSRRYGALNAPLIVATMCMSPFFDGSTAEDALFGSKAVQYYEGRPESVRWIRMRNGAWSGISASRTAGVSAALIGDSILPWTHTRELPRMWLNPWAQQHVVDTAVFSTGTANNAGVISYAENQVNVHEIFAVPEWWPGDFQDIELSDGGRTRGQCGS